ncbi:MAG TPA: cold shock domain-containing protein [Candidatus Polarisedimenticolia bacterium]|nr:cold shock domain-containing protein [Candidatus Polarisedimenticolia bacterium]
MRHVGRVKWWNASRGLGCIVAEGGESFAVRAAAIRPLGSRFLEEGQPVEFDLVLSPRGGEAERVVPIDRASE